MGDWRSGSAAPLHGEGRQFDPVIAYHITAYAIECVSSVNPIQGRSAMCVIENLNYRLNYRAYV